MAAVCRTKLAWNLPSVLVFTGEKKYLAPHSQKELPLSAIFWSQ